MNATLRDRAVLLSAWEAASGLPDVARGPALVQRAGLVADLATALDLPLGQSAALAASLYADAFGDRIDGLRTCEGCGAELHVTVPLDVLPASGGDRAIVVTADGRELHVRAPTTRDLLEVAGCGEPAAALLARCVTDAAGSRVSRGALHDGDLATVDESAEELAGAAALLIRAECPDCGTEVTAAVDIGALLWDRVAREAAGVLAEVAELAAAFGWSEADVLALGDARRGAYLELARETR